VPSKYPTREQKLLQEFEGAFIQHLTQDKDVEVRTYLGEFDSQETMDGIIKDGKNIIFFDFTGDSYEHPFRKQCDYSLYFVGATASKSAVYRKEIKDKIIKLIEQTDEKFLTFHSPEYTIPPLTKTLKKIRDNFTDNFGYLVTFERTFSVQIIHKGALTNEL
jgi:hypothetical protein